MGIQCALPVCAHPCAPILVLPESLADSAPYQMIHGIRVRFISREAEKIPESVKFRTRCFTIFLITIEIKIVKNAHHSCPCSSRFLSEKEEESIEGNCSSKKGQKTANFKGLKQQVGSVKV